MVIIAVQAICRSDFGELKEDTASGIKLGRPLDAGLLIGTESWEVVFREGVALPAGCALLLVR